MMMTLSRKPLVRKPLAASALLALVLSMGGISHAAAQEGLLIRNIFGSLGIFPEEKAEIDYKERAPIVVPKDTTRLRTPETSAAHTRSSQWPVDPDIEDRKRELAKRNQTIIPALKADPSEGGRLSVGDMARGRAQRGAVIGEAPTPRNDRDGVRIQPDEWAAQSKQATAPTYAPGTEPPRQYLTDPPKGLRTPSASAPMAKTSDAPVGSESFRPADVWKRLD